MSEPARTTQRVLLLDPFTIAETLGGGGDDVGTIKRLSAAADTDESNERRFGLRTGRIPDFLLPRAGTVKIQDDLNLGRERNTEYDARADAWVTERGGWRESATESDEGSGGDDYEWAHEFLERLRTQVDGAQEALSELTRHLPLEDFYVLCRALGVPECRRRHRKVNVSPRQQQRRRAKQPIRAA